jgi:hypothetical protein
MTRLMLTGAAALALSAAPALAQEAATGDQPMRDAAIQSAQGAGMQGVSGLEGAFVLQGMSATGVPVLMVVGPAGELLALATPIVVPTAAAGAEAAAEAAAGAEAEAGEPAEGGYMATQADPASPQMWDPAAVEGAMQSLELGLRGAAGEVPSP